MATIVRDEFRNESGGFLGVTTINARGDRVGIAVPPNDTVWLSDEEQVETANAPRSPDANPFINGQLVLVTEAAEVRNRRPLRPEPDGAEPDAQPEEETGATPEPPGEPEEGSYAPGEEVGTPEAASAAPRRRKPVATG